VALDELGETGVVCCSKDEHVTELTGKRKKVSQDARRYDGGQGMLTHGPCRRYSSR
jgi:hypothetical protein